jgi:N-dimethylarginine dimethylaminohydrolase
VAGRNSGRGNGVGVVEGDRALADHIREHDVTVLEADVSEFYKKGGGSVKCMIGDLGEIPSSST